MGNLAGFGVVLCFVVHVAFVGWLHGGTSCKDAACYSIVRKPTPKRGFNTKRKPKQALKVWGLHQFLRLDTLLYPPHTSYM